MIDDTKMEAIVGKFVKEAEERRLELKGFVDSGSYAVYRNLLAKVMDQRSIESFHSGDYAYPGLANDMAESIMPKEDFDAFCEIVLRDNPSQVDEDCPFENVYVDLGTGILVGAMYGQGTTTWIRRSYDN